MTPSFSTDKGRTVVPPVSHHASDASPLAGSDLLLWSALPDLTLNIAQTAALCGVSVRQLGYWTKQGYVTATGTGSRRLYGPEALRRILAIRQAMQDGLSLRQALRALASHPSPQREAVYPHSAPSIASSLSGNFDAVAADLVTLFERDRHIHDSAGGLAVKVGRHTAHVRQAAETLAAQGMLTRTETEDEVIYARLGGAFA